MASMTPGGIAYDSSGQGDPALLLLPGWCGPRTLFEPLMTRLDGYGLLGLDWRGHGESKASGDDFGTAELVEDALDVLEHAGVDRVVPVSAAHAGWVAIELRRRLGPSRVPRLVFLDWMVLGPPPPFLEALRGMASRPTTRAVVDQVTSMWMPNVDVPAITAYVQSMAAFPDEMWARAARAISEAFEEHGSPLDAVAALDPPPPTLHLYAQPPAGEYLEAQRGVAAERPWFAVEHLEATSHFPIFEVPDVIADRIDRFVRS